MYVWYYLRYTPDTDTDTGHRHRRRRRFNLSFLQNNHSIVLSVWSIDELPTSNKKALGFNNSLARKMEPKSTELATQRIVKILDVKYEKANLPDIVENECAHLNPTEKLQLLELLIEFEDLFNGTLVTGKLSLSPLN